MRLTIEKVTVGDDELERLLLDAFNEVGVPQDEEWTGAVAATSKGVAWEVVLEGPARHKAAHVDWEILQRDQAKVRYRKLFHGKYEQDVEVVKGAVRKLLWERIQFRDNPIRNLNPKLGQAFEDAVWEVLRNEEMNPLQVRFGVWRSEPDCLRFVCKVEYVAVPGSRQHAWNWWSSLVRTPQDLANELQRALTNRRKHQAAMPSARTLQSAERRKQGAVPGWSWGYRPASAAAAAAVIPPEKPEERLRVASAARA